MKNNNLQKEKKRFAKLISKKNKPVSVSNGIYNRYKNPIITANHAPLHWRYDLNAETNPLAFESIQLKASLARLGGNSLFVS